MSDRRGHRLRQAAARALDRDGTAAPTELRDEVRTLETIIDALSALPAEAWRGVPARPRASAARRSMFPRGRRPIPVVALAACLAAGCLALGFLAGRATTTPARPARARSALAIGRVVFRPLRPGSTASAVAVMFPADHMLLRVTRLPSSRPGTYYELWLMTNARILTPVASFRIGASRMVELSLALPDDPRRYAYLDISQQRLGSGTRHSALSVLRAPTA